MNKPQPARPTAHPSAPLRSLKRRPKGTLITFALLVLFFAGVFILAHDRHPPRPVVYVAALVSALLALLLVRFAVSELGGPYKTFSLLKWKKLDTGAIGGGVAFALMLALWFSPLAPIKPGIPKADDLARMLSDELEIYALVVPDEHLAAFQVPSPSPQAAIMAEDIPRGADHYSLAVKAIAEGRYADVDQELREAELLQQAKPEATAILRVQKEMFAGNFEEAAAGYQKLLESQPKDAAFAAQLALAFALVGNFDRAAAIAEPLIVESGDTSPQVIGVLPARLNLLAAIYICQGKFSQAEELSQRAQKLWEDRQDSTDSRVAACVAASRNNQGVLYATQPHRYAGAESQYRGALTKWKEIYGERHPRVANGLANLAVLQKAQAQFPNARETLAAAAVIADSFHSKHPTRAVVLIGQAALDDECGRYDEALAEIGRAQEILGKALGPRMIATLYTTASILAHQGRYDDAAKNYQQSLALAKRLLPEDHPFIAAGTNGQAEVDVRKQSFDAAVRLAERSVQSLSSKLGDDHPSVARARNTLGFALLGLDRRNEAQKQFEMALAIFNRTSKTSPLKLPEEGRSLAGLGALSTNRTWRDGAGQYRKAIELDTELFTIPGADGASPVRPQHPVIAAYQADLAQLYATYGTAPTDFDTAMTLFQDALRTCQATLPPGHPQLIAVTRAYAELLRKRGRNAEAGDLEKSIPPVKSPAANSE